jgi:hypothetical protein
VSLLLVATVVVTTLVVRHGSPPVAAPSTPTPMPTAAVPTNVAAGTQRDAVPPASTAAVALAQAVTTSSARIPALDGSWVAQISSKRVGLLADGIAYDQEAILDDFRRSESRFPQAVLLDSNRFVTFSSPDFYVTVIAIPFTTAARANAWCTQQLLPADRCFAKRLSTVPVPGATVAHR